MTIEMEFAIPDKSEGFFAAAPLRNVRFSDGRLFTKFCVEVKSAAMHDAIALLRSIHALRNAKVRLLQYFRL